MRRATRRSPRRWRASPICARSPQPHSCSGRGLVRAIGALDVLYVVLAIDVLNARRPGGFPQRGLRRRRVSARAIRARGGRRASGSTTRGSGVCAGSFFVHCRRGRRAGAALGCSRLAGAGRLLLDVAGRTLLQRTGPPVFLSRVFGVLEWLTMAGLAIGSHPHAAARRRRRARSAIVGVGAVLPLVALLMDRRLLRIDADRTVPVVEISLLRSMPLFAGLPAAGARGARASARACPCDSGETVIREGEAGDRFYAVCDGPSSVG